MHMGHGFICTFCATATKCGIQEISYKEALLADLQLVTQYTVLVYGTGS